MQTKQYAHIGCEAYYVGKRVRLLDDTIAVVVRIDERGILVAHKDGRYIYLPDWMV